jgi:hypothetical protein
MRTLATTAMPSSRIIENAYKSKEKMLTQYDGLSPPLNKQWRHTQSSAASHINAFFRALLLAGFPAGVVRMGYGLRGARLLA